MIAKVYRGSSLDGTVRYCHRKSTDRRPLASSVVSEDPQGPDEEAVLREFSRVNETRQAARPVVRISIFIRPSESLSRDQWLEVAERVRSEMGFEDCPWAAYLIRFEDGRKGEYLHLVLSRVTFDGKIVSDGYRVMKVMRGLERDLGLAPVGET
jgi:relaxase-like protein